MEASDDCDLVRCIYGICRILPGRTGAHTDLERRMSDSLLNPGGSNYYVEIKICIAIRCTVLCELGNRADRPFGRSASGGRFRKPGTDGNTWFAGDSPGGNGNPTC